MPSEPAGRRTSLGIMTGTSLDGLDAAIVETRRTGPQLRVERVEHQASEIPDSLRDRLRHLADGEAATAADIANTRRQLGELYAEAAAELCASCNFKPADLTLASLHGQTIWHQPTCGISWQLLDPWPVAAKLGCPVVYDLRQADLMAGGQGAPITPSADWVMFRKHAEVVMNLGGIANATRLAPHCELVLGGDIVPCNLLLDAMADRLLGEAYDRDGASGLAGQADAQAVARCGELVETAIRHHVTLGREQVSERLLGDLHDAVRPLSANDALRTVCRIIAERTIAWIGERHGTDRRPVRVLLAGGGGYNAALVAELRAAAGDQMSIELTSTVGVPIDAREAAAMAILGLGALDGWPITKPLCTGRKGLVVSDGAWIGRPSQPGI